MADKRLKTKQAALYFLFACFMKLVYEDIITTVIIYPAESENLSGLTQWMKLSFFMIDSHIYTVFCAIFSSNILALLKFMKCQVGSVL